MIDDLFFPAFAHFAHQATDPRAALRIGKGNAPLAEEPEDEIENAAAPRWRSR
ncbi:MAG: hypothetical protein WDN28_09115 [Chthoniobacter sp.]